MTITGIELQGFKSFKQTHIPLRPLTLLCGFNNSGKSSVIQALRMYCNSTEGLAPLLPSHGSVDELRSRFVDQAEPISFRCSFDNNDTGLFTLTNDSFTPPGFAPLSCYLSADRWGPKISLPLAVDLNKFPSIGDHGEYVIGFLDALSLAIIPEMLRHEKARGETLEYQIAGWLEEIAPGVELSFETDPKHDAAFIAFNSFRPTNVGFGLSYCLPLLAAILGMAARKPATGWEEKWGAQWEEDKKTKGMLVMIENPEAHLHPSGQTALGKLIALGVKCGLQIIVETQSDHLMDGVRIAVKDQLLTADAVAFHYLTRSKDGETNVESPTLHSNGKLEYWPDGFFDQTLKNRSHLAR